MTRKYNTVMEQYLQYFNNQSKYNKMYGRLTCHAIIGNITRHIKIKIGDYYDDNRVNVFYVAPSGTGKTTGSNVYIDIMEKLGMQVHELDDFTDASVAGTVRYIEIEDEEGRIEKIAEQTEGILEINDVIHSDEASLLLMPNTYSMKTVIFIQKACNPIGSAGNKITRTLASGQTEATAECTFVFTTFPPRPGSKEVGVMVENGLLQRMAFYPRIMDHNMHMKMTHSMIDGLFYKFDGDDVITTDKSRVTERLVGEFEAIRREYQNTKFIPIRSRFRVFMKNKAKMMYKHLIEQQTRHEIREIMYTYVNRYIILIVKFATHHAIMNGEKEVKKNNLEYGWRLVFEMFKMSAHWLSIHLPDNYQTKDEVEENSPHSIIYKTYARCLKREKSYPKVPEQFISRTDLIRAVKKHFDMSRAWFDENAKELVTLDKAVTFEKGRRIFYKIEPLNVTVAEDEDDVDLMLQLNLNEEFH